MDRGTVIDILERIDVVLQAIVYSGGTVAAAAFVARLVAQGERPYLMNIAGIALASSAVALGLSLALRLVFKRRAGD